MRHHEAIGGGFMHLSMKRGAEGNLGYTWARPNWSMGHGAGPLGNIRFRVLTETAATR